MARPDPAEQALNEALARQATKAPDAGGTPIRPHDYDLRVRECEAAERQAAALEKIVEWLDIMDTNLLAGAYRMSS